MRPCSSRCGNGWPGGWPSRSPPPVRPAALGPRAGMLGAALLGWQAAGDDDAGADWTLDVLRGGSVS
ncbi:hypothetical protein [Microbispora sp. GKU 823]|uniref:hypothetical protein n=1 Tax=Microbispora sp. GKU 823 TaxID=1652100 RepID=UPI002117E56B|nr:hypothetical protein [Microbispora sp. GKU 823]